MVSSIAGIGVADGPIVPATLSAIGGSAMVEVLELDLPASLEATSFRFSLRHDERKSVAIMVSTRKSWLLLARAPLKVENLFHPDLVEIRSSFFIEISSGDLFARNRCTRKSRILRLHAFLLHGILNEERLLNLHA
jgi:hypothetical protein